MTDTFQLIPMNQYLVSVQSVPNGTLHFIEVSGELPFNVLEPMIP